MIKEPVDLINDQTSPLFRVMYAYNADEKSNLKLEGNVCAFHVGNGVILTVAHNLRAEAGIFHSIDEATFQKEVLSKLNSSRKTLFNKHFIQNNLTGKRYLNVATQEEVKVLVNYLQKINFDTRWITMHQRGICKPFLVVTLKSSDFYGDPALTKYFKNGISFKEPNINRYNFLLELDLIEVSESNDIAMYKVVNIHPEVINRLPSIEPDFDFLSIGKEKTYCLQSAPNSAAGHMLNEVKIEGILDHFGMLPDRIGGPYILEGFRYIIKGYFRFGSSGAPYIFYDEVSNSYKVSAIQSEACPIQLSIGGKMDGNSQYINAIATPISSIKDKIVEHLVTVEELKK